MKEDFELKIGKDVLVGSIFSPPNEVESEVLIFLNGSGGTRDRFYAFGEHFSDKGHTLVCFDFRGRRDSTIEEFATLTTQIEDAKTVVEYIQSRAPLKDSDITLVATSMGAHVASVISNISPAIKRLILIAPALYPKSLEDKDYTKITVREFEDLTKEALEDAGSLEELRKFAGELYVVFLGEDSTIPRWMVQMYLDNGESASKITQLDVEGSPHAIFRDPEWRAKALDLLDHILIRDKS